MAIAAKIAPVYGAQKIFAALLCAVFGVWGAYDYWVSIPQQEKTYAQYETLKSKLQELEQSKTKHLERGTQPSPVEIEEFNTTTAELNALAPNSVAPTKPSKFNRATQWVYIACLPFAFYLAWMFVKARRQVYTLDDVGTLHFSGDPALGKGAWTGEQIADIDMSRWMAKSIAHVIHVDSTRLKLDAYLHKDLHLIIGEIAARMHPEKWTSEAKPVKAAPEAAPLPAAAE